MVLLTKLVLKQRDFWDTFSGLQVCPIDTVTCHLRPLSHHSPPVARQTARDSLSLQFPSQSPFLPQNRKRGAIHATVLRLCNNPGITSYPPQSPALTREAYLISSAQSASLQQPPSHLALVPALRRLLQVGAAPRPVVASHHLTEKTPRENFALFLNRPFPVCNIAQGLYRLFFWIQSLGPCSGYRPIRILSYRQLGPHLHL